MAHWLTPPSSHFRNQKPFRLKHMLRLDQRLIDAALQILTNIPTPAADNHQDLALRIKEFQFRDIRPRAASDIEDISQASKLLGHSSEKITKDVYRRRGEIVNPTKLTD